MTDSPEPLSGQLTSLLADVVGVFPHLRPQMYFKSSLVALSHAMEDHVLSEQGHPIVFANFQRERYYQQEAHRYERISHVAQQVYILAVPETKFAQDGVPYHMIPVDPEDPLAQEWHLIIVDQTYAMCLVCRERLLKDPRSATRILEWDTSRQFEGIWSFERKTALQAADLLIPKIVHYRPELESRLSLYQQQWRQEASADASFRDYGVDPSPFTERLITYIQAGQYKLQRAYKAIQLKERKESLINQISNAMRHLLDTHAIVQVVVEQLGQGSGVTRCLLYRCSEAQDQVMLEHEFVDLDQPSLRGKLWPLAANSLLIQAMQTQHRVTCEDTETDPVLASTPKLWHPWRIRSWLVVPVLYQRRLLGILELHREVPGAWENAVIELAEGIAFQVGVALIQAEAYQHLEELNHQLAALDRAKSDLIAVTGHELRTPLSTIQVCLESLASEPDMPMELRQEMLNTALQDSERLRRLVQDFLTLSQLESGRVQWHFESISPVECVELSVSNISARRRHEPLPRIQLDLPDPVPMVFADGEWVVEVLSKLIDNACKFTPSTGQITIGLKLASLGSAIGSGTGSGVPGEPPKGKSRNKDKEDALQFSVTDTGRGIEAQRLEAVFERFYQVEGSLRRTVGGTGLGLAICREAVKAMGGKIWAESKGIDQGSALHVLLPLVKAAPTPAKRKK